MNLGEKIKKIRESNNINQSQFGELLGVKQRAVSNWEHNIFEPSLDKIQTMSKIFKIPSSYWFDDEIVVNKENAKRLVLDAIDAYK